MKINLKSKFTIVISILILFSFIIGTVSAIVLFSPKKDSEKDKISSFEEIKVFEKALDVLDIGNTESENTHKLKKTGNITSEKTAYEIGVVKNEKKAILFNNNGDTAVFYMNISSMTPKNKNNPIVLELEELHNIGGGAFGYTVFVNDKPAYFRTYEQMMTGAVNVYIHLARKDIADLSNVKITITNNSNTKFAISKAILYADLYGMSERQKLDTKMGINLFLGSNDLTKLNSELEQYKRDYKNFKFGIQTEYAFMQSNPADMNYKMDFFINMNKTNKMPVYIMPARWWAPATGSVDGEGGYFSDLKHNQAVYNTLTGEYQMTTPNQWGNTPWPSMNSPQVIKAGAEKIEDMSEYFSKRLALTQARYPDAMNPFYFVMEWGAGYWGTNIFNSGGDFSDIVVEAAAKDGVTLDPKDGVSDTEKAWMFKNVARYFESEAVAYQKGLFSNSIGVNKGVLSYPQYQLSNNIYSHAIQGTIYPAYDDKFAAWQSGVSEYNWPSSEMYAFEDYRHYDYSMSLGKISCVNLEMTMLTKLFFQEYLKQCYANGMEFLTMFNAKKKEEGMYIKQVDALNETEYEGTKPYNKTLLDVDSTRDYIKDFNKNGIPGAVKTSNLTAGKDGIISRIDNNAPGEVIFKATNDLGLNTGLNLDMEAFYQGDSSVQVYAGTSLSNMEKLPDFVMGQKVDWFNKCSLYQQDLSKYKDSRDIYIKVVLNAKLIENVYLKAIKLSVPWEKKTGQLNSEKVTYLQKRIQSLNTQYRAVSQRMLKQYLEKAGNKDDKYKKAVDLYDNGQYFDTYKFLCMAVSEALPATFSISGYGKLGEYPVEASLKNETDAAVVRLLKASDTGYEISFISDKIQEITLKIGNLKKGKKYSLIYKDSNLVEIKEDKNGKLLKDKILVCKIKIGPEILPKVTGQIEGVAKSVTDSSIVLEIQDPKIGHYSNGVSFNFTGGCKFERGQEGAAEVKNEKPKTLDYVVATLNKDGLISEIKASYGSITGVVKNYKKPELKGPDKSNGVIELTNGMKFELSYSNNMSNFDLVSLTGRAKDYSYTMLRDAIKPGMIVTIDYVPITYNNTNRRIIKIKQDVINLLEEDFEGDWGSKTWSKKNIKSIELDKTNSFKVIQPDSNKDPGELVYKFQTSRPIGEASIVYSGRAIINDKCYLNIYVGSDGKNWDKVGGLKFTDTDSNLAKQFRNIDISEKVANKNSFYVKIEVASTTETWGSLNDLSVKAVIK